jgi:hypothetical protein
MKTLALVALLLPACSGPLSSAESKFRRGDYAAARQLLERAEGETSGWSAEDQARYALCRGLTHAALGDRAHAVPWLHWAKALDDSRPGSLSFSERVKLENALNDVP